MIWLDQLFSKHITLFLQKRPIHLKYNIHIGFISAVYHHSDRSASRDFAEARDWPRGASSPYVYNICGKSLQAILLNSGGNRQRLPDPRRGEAAEVYPLLRTDLNGWAISMYSLFEMVCTFFGHLQCAPLGLRGLRYLLTISASRWRINSRRIYALEGRTGAFGLESSFERLHFPSIPL